MGKEGLVVVVVVVDGGFFVLGDLVVEIFSGVGSYMGFCSVLEVESEFYCLEFVKKRAF